MTDPDVFYNQIMDAVEESGLARLVIPGGPPTAVFGPGDQVDITFNIDQQVSTEWDTLIITPSEDEPPRWLVRLTNIIEDDEISSNPDPDSDEPSHDSVRDAMMAVAEQLAEREDGKYGAPL